MSQEAVIQDQMTYIVLWCSSAGVRTPIAGIVGRGRRLLADNSLRAVESGWRQVLLSVSSAEEEKYQACNKGETNDTTDDATDNRPRVAALPLRVGTTGGRSRGRAAACSAPRTRASSGLGWGGRIACCSDKRLSQGSIPGVRG